MKLVICSSVAFYREVITIKNELVDMGIEVVLPRTAERMESANDYDVTHFFQESDNWSEQKAELIRTHFEKIAAGDAVLVINNDKHGQEDYIGPNVLMEMAVAFNYHKPIYLLNKVPSDSSFADEINGMQPIELNGDIASLAS